MSELVPPEPASTPVGAEQKHRAPCAAEVAQAAASADVKGAIAVLTSSDPVRGCAVNPDRAHLQALQDAVGWTIGVDTRPDEEGAKLKQEDRMRVLVTYRQPLPKPGEPPRVTMYDFLCDSLFDIPMRPVDAEVEVPCFLDESGCEVVPMWIESDWDAFNASGKPRPSPVLRPNRYPYQLPVVSGRCARHAILWYFHFPWESLPDPSDNEITNDLLTELMVASTAEGHEGYDYIWYRNPKMSVPDMFHVQVFWRPAASRASI